MVTVVFRAAVVFACVFVFLLTSLGVTAVLFDKDGYRRRWKR